jgi:NAD(P)-dependent dehydrogenase (short-subunit alcohol dehydrogenase family)
MNVSGRVVVVTGAARGIGRALCERFHAEGARAVVAADLDADGAAETAASVGGMAFSCDVSKSEEVERMVEEVERDLGPIDLFCSNAGVLEIDPDFDNAASATDAQWARSWGVNVMGHVYAARALLPRMIPRGGGYFLNTVSAAGLLSQIGAASYSTTKHAGIGFAEHLAITHRDDRIKVSVLCPQGVDTAMVRGASELQSAFVDGVLTPEEVAACVIEGLAAERFLILPHPQVAAYMQKKATDYDRWLGGMSKMRRALKGG